MRSSDCQLPVRQRGFSLIELVASIVIMGLIFGGFVTVFGEVMRHGNDPQFLIQAKTIGEAYMSEAMSRDYLDPQSLDVCPVAEGLRTQYDNVCDYRQLSQNGCVATSAACPQLGSCACDRFGQPVAGLSGFGISMSVQQTTLAGVAGLDIEVQVSHDSLDGSNLILQGFRSAD